MLTQGELGEQYLHFVLGLCTSALESTNDKRYCTLKLEMC
jgi:hypothetical protein